MGPASGRAQRSHRADRVQSQPYIPKAFRLSLVSDFRLEMGDRLDLYPEP
jgi:hypothetical protein